MASKEEENSEVSLKNIFEDALRSYVGLQPGCCDATQSQPQIKKTIEKLEEATRLINAIQMFSSNELLEEVATENIQYLGIPAMLGTLAGQLTSPNRLANLEVSEIYFKDFLKRANEYGLVPDSMKQAVEQLECENAERKLTEKENIARLVIGKNEKVRRFQEQKQIERDLVELKKNLERADDEVRRKYFMLFVKGMVIQADDELKSIEMEKPLAEMMLKNPDRKLPKRPAPPPLKPVTIVRNELEKKVFGLGYPSRPTMTVDEFYEERVREGIFPSGPSKYANSLQVREDPEANARMEEEEDVRKENAVETDDPEALERQRQMDDFKDEHRRGYGNRYNRS